MPRVSKCQSWFGGEQFDRVINVNGDGLFSVKLPDFADSVLGYSTVTDSTREGVERKFADASRDFTAARATKRKIIIYGVKRAANIYLDGPPKNPVSRCVMNLREVSFAEGIALDFYAGVFEETRATSPLKLKDTYSYQILDSSMPFSIEPKRDLFRRGGAYIENQIEWTPEREAFFANTGLALERILLAFNKIDNREKVLALADAPQSGQPLLLT